MSSSDSESVPDATDYDSDSEHSETHHKAFDLFVKIFKNHKHGYSRRIEPVNNFKMVGCPRGIGVSIQPSKHEKGAFIVSIDHRCQGPVMACESVKYHREFQELVVALCALNEPVALRIEINENESVDDWEKILSAMKHCGPIVKTLQLWLSGDVERDRDCEKISQVLSLAVANLPSIDTFWFDESLSTSAHKGVELREHIVAHLLRFPCLSRVAVRFVDEIDGEFVQELCEVARIKHVNVQCVSLTNYAFLDEKATFDDCILTDSYLPDERQTRADVSRAAAAYRLHVERTRLAQMSCYEEHTDSSSESSSDEY